MADRVQKILTDPQAEKFMANRAYALFSRVVNYSECMRGIVSITIDSCPGDEVFIATSIDSIIMQDCDFSGCDSWTVYVMSSSQSGAQVSGDLLVFTSDQRLVLTGSGIKFTRYPISKLEKVSRRVQTATENPKPILQRSRPWASGLAWIGGDLTKLPAVKVAVRQLTPSDSTDDEVVIVSRPSETLHSTQPPALTEDHIYPGKGSSIRAPQRLLELISENCGDPLANVEDGAILQDVGVDSLSVIELASSVEYSFGIQLSDDNLHLQSTIAEILDYLHSMMPRAIRDL
ncbi:Uu.00g030790.m01.CDS01 [Anthostomella pinea]|uniref:Uu.00g030790.m01.CDS01 n=1 Tax=Anthostomella pinea TaxID=933095 RepID=A0AAI8V8D5_9PEZI|nr:Uu.00g030790.m01.CDS01 [Anthostomella pinea]